MVNDRLVQDDKYFTVTGWMINNLGLENMNELSIYAIIYGFSCNKTCNKFTGSLKYLQEWLQVSKPTVIKILKKLVEHNLIIKTEIDKNGVTLCEYVVNFDYECDGVKVVKKPEKDVDENDVTDLTGSKEILPPQLKKFTQYNNYNTSNTSYSNTSYYHTSYDNTRNNYTQGPEPEAQATSELKKHITKNSKTHKWVNRVVGYIQTKQVDKEVYALLIDFIKNLVEMDTRLPFVSIKQQIDALLELNIEKQKQALIETNVNGWKSLKFSIDKINNTVGEARRYRGSVDGGNNKYSRNRRGGDRNGKHKPETMTDVEKAKLREKLLSEDQKWY